MELKLGDCLVKLKEMADNSVDSIVTDPPYGLSFMNKHWDYDVPSVEIWHEALRVLKPGGHLLAFFGTRTYHRGVIRIEDAGFEIRDCIQWIYGSGFPKSHNLKDEHKGWGTALKPANEPIVVARKPLVGTVADNFAKYGTGAMNIDGCRIGTEIRFNPPVGELTGFGSTRTEAIGSGTVVQGRWPANLILDEEAGEMLDAHSGASRFFYVAKASKKERNAGLEGMPLVKSGVIGTGEGGGPMLTGSGNERKNLNQNHHPTVKPIKLMEYLCKLITPHKGMVLDPFMGSGSTGVAAKNLGFQFTGIELNEEYYEIAKRRIG